MTVDLFIRLEARLQPNAGFAFRRVLSVFTRSAITAESEPIWMKYGALWVHCRELVLTDFERDPRSSDSWRARRNFVVFLSGKPRTISPISRRPIHEIWTQLTRWSVSR